MRIKRIDKTAATEITIGDVNILVSYETPVACFIPGKGFQKTDKKWSATTSKHINRWLAGHGADAKNVPTIPQADLDAMLSV